MANKSSSHFQEEREQIILDFLEHEGKIRIGDVTDLLQISPSTARILLQKMHDKGLLQRTHGGAIAVGHKAGQSESRDFIEIPNRDKRQRIAEAAAATVEDGDFIAIGSGMTCYLLSTMLHGKTDLTVVTDSIPVVNELLNDENITLYACGGWILKESSAFRGAAAENFFHDLQVDKSYCGADMLNIRTGVHSFYFDPRTEAAACRCGSERYILADSTKFSTRSSVNKVAGIDEIGHVVSDTELDEESRNALTAAGIELILA